MDAHLVVTALRVVEMEQLLELLLIGLQVIHLTVLGVVLIMQQLMVDHPYIGIKQELMEHV
jgi:hypothetical protein